MPEPPGWILSDIRNQVQERGCALYGCDDNAEAQALLEWLQKKLPDDRYGVCRLPGRRNLEVNVFKVSKGPIKPFRN